MAKKVIWADDNAIVRESMLARLDRCCENVGIEVEFDKVSDGKELVEKVLGGAYDLVFTDNQMTEVHGLQAIREIREQNQTVPIYMISSSEELYKMALGMGATGFHSKMDYKGFISFIETAIEAHLK